MVIEYIRYQIPAERHAEFRAAYLSAGVELRASPQCLRHEVSQGVEEPDHFIVRIEWDSVDGHLKIFRASAEFAAFFAKVKPFFSNILEMKHYQVDAP
jgi:quinol monooxygenase YgiN